MAILIPDFDFDAYDPRDTWNFPAQRVVRFAAEVYHIASEARQQYARLYPHPDQRFVVFHELSGLAHALLLGAMQMRSHGTDETWWQSQAEITHSVDTRLMASNNMALRQMLHLGYAQGVMRQLDMAMRQYAVALTGEAAATQWSLHRVWARVVADCSCIGYAPLLPLLQLHRDSLSQLGRFCPADGKPLNMSYKNRRMHFLPQTEITHTALGFIDEWDFMRFLVVEAVAMLHEIHRDSAMTAIPMIATRYIS